MNTVNRVTVIQYFPLCILYNLPGTLGKLPVHDPEYIAEDGMQNEDERKEVAFVCNPINASFSGRSIINEDRRNE